MQGNNLFAHGLFRNMLPDHGNAWRLTPPRRHFKIVLESKHQIIRSIFVCFSSSTEPALCKELTAIGAICISNDLYKSDVLSAYEMPKGFTQSIFSSPTELATDPTETQLQLQSKRSLFIYYNPSQHTTFLWLPVTWLRSSSSLTRKNEVKWLSPCTVLSLGPSLWTITVSFGDGKTMKAATEDIRLAVIDDLLATLVRPANDVLHETLHDIDFQTDVPIDQSAQSSPQLGEHGHHSSTYFPDYTGDESDRTLPKVDDRVELSWPDDNSYYAGTVDGDEGNARQITCDDDDVENLALENEQ